MIGKLVRLIGRQIGRSKQPRRGRLKPLKRLSVLPMKLSRRNLTSIFTKLEDLLKLMMILKCNSVLTIPTDLHSKMMEITTWITL